MLAPHTSAVSERLGVRRVVARRASDANVSRDRRYSSKMPSTSPSDVTAWSCLRSSADPGSPFTYQPRCLRNSIAAPRRSGS